jgi:hypothetical protein
MKKLLIDNVDFGDAQKCGGYKVFDSGRGNYIVEHLSNFMGNRTDQKWRIPKTKATSPEDALDWVENYPEQSECYKTQNGYIVE